MSREFTLVLGGTGVKGIASIGVLEALSSQSIKVKKIIAAGTSALVAAQYALKKRPADLVGMLVNFFTTNHKYLWGVEEMSGLFQTRKRKVVDSIDYFLRERLYCRANFNRISVLSWDLVDPLLIETFGDKTFKDLEIPVVFSTIDLNLKTLFQVHSGKLVDAIKASIAYPGLFPPVIVNRRAMGSSTAYCELPLHSISKENYPVLAVDFPTIFRHERPHTLIEIISRVNEIRGQAIKNRLIKNADYIIELENMNRFRWGNYNRIPGMIRLAREKTIHQLVPLMAL